MAADVKISALTALLGADVSALDLLVAVDVSDLSMANSGTDKKLTMGALATYLGVSGTNTGDVTLGTPNGLSLVGQVLSLGAADENTVGALTASAQTIGGVKTFSNTVVAAAGAVATPSVRFAGTTDTGFYSPGDQVLGIAWGGVSRVLFGNAGNPIYVPTGVSYFGGGLTSAGPTTLTSYLRVSGAPVGTNLTNGQDAYLGSYNNNIGSAALWLAVAPSTTNYAVAVSTSGGLGTPIGTTLAGTPAIVMGRNGAGASDVVVKLGTATAAASVSDSAKLLQILAGIGGTETEYAWFKKPHALGQGVLTLDGKNLTNAMSLVLINQGIGYSGIAFNSFSEVMLGIGSASTRGFQVSCTNRTQSWSVNSGAFSTGARALYDWESTEDALQKTLPFARYQCDAAHTGDFVRWYVGNTLVRSMSATGKLVGDGGMESSAGSTVFTLTESFMKGLRGSAAWSLNEAGGGTAQLYNSAAGVEVSATTVNLWGRGTQSTDIGARIGFSTADASVHSSAKLATFGTGYGGSWADYLSITKGGTVTHHGGAGATGKQWTYVTENDLNGNHWEWRFRSGQDMTWGNNSSTYFGCSIGDGYIYSAFGFRVMNAAGSTTYFKAAGAGRFDQWGTDSSASPGSATIDKASGVSAIAGGATTVTITNSLVGASSRVMITWLGDLGVQSKIPWVTRAAGSFTVNVGTAPAGAVSFGWEISNLL